MSTATLPRRMRAVVMTTEGEPQGSTCPACGHGGTERDPLVIAADGYRVHLSHVLDPASGYYGEPFAAETRAA